jgi:hypothetical protein
MWAYVLLNLVASILCVALIHYLWNYFRDKYTVKKTHDIVGAQTQKYKDMMAELLEEPLQMQMQDQVQCKMQQQCGEECEYISPEEKEEMIRELRLLLIQ